MPTKRQAGTLDHDAESEVLVEQAERLDRSCWSNLGENHDTDGLLAWMHELSAISMTLKQRGASSPLRDRISLLVRTHELLQEVSNTSFVESIDRAARWNALESTLIREGVESVILYGAGQHTRWLLESGWPSDPALKIQHIVDDHIADEFIHGIPVRSPALVSVDDPERCVVLPSSDAHEKQLMDPVEQLAASLHARSMRVYTAECAMGDTAQASDEQSCTPSVITDENLEIDRSPLHRLQLGLSTERAWLDEFRSLPALVDWATGYMNDIDAAFTWDIIEHTAAEHRDDLVVVEVGTASGVSTARVAQGLDVLAASRWRLHTYDIASRCYFDETRHVGSATQDMAPGLLDRIHIHTKHNAIDAARDFPPGSVQLAIIDADHDHPSPAMDLLALLPALATGAWVILHDIELGIIMGHPDAVTDSHTGPSRLFHAYPGIKLRESRVKLTESNTGALQMPEDPLSLRGFLLDLIATRA